MIHYIKDGDLFDSGADILVNTVNCVGVMGKGIALEFKRRFPEYYADYRKACNEGLVKPGVCRLWIYKPIIISFPTKDHWRNPSKIEWIESGLKSLIQRIATVQDNPFLKDAKVVAIPALGCANGGLDWVEVKPLIEKELSLLPNHYRKRGIQFLVYEPHS